MGTLQYRRNGDNGDAAERSLLTRRNVITASRFAGRAGPLRTVCTSVDQSPSVRPSVGPSHDGQLDAANLFTGDGPIFLLARRPPGWIVIKRCTLGRAKARSAAGAGELIDATANPI